MKGRAGRESDRPFSFPAQRLFGARAAELAQSGMAMAEAARGHSQVFVDNGLPENFADAIVAAVEAMRASIDARVKSVLADDPKALAAWRSAKRIGKGKVLSIEVTAPAAPAQTAEVKAAQGAGRGLGPRPQPSVPPESGRQPLFSSSATRAFLFQ